MIPKLEDCKPGLRPMGYNVLVAVDVVEEKTAGGIILPGKHTERESSASEKGRVVAVSQMAFTGGDWTGVIGSATSWRSGPVPALCRRRRTYRAGGRQQIPHHR
jgi:hypothetical protein